ncbi:MAG: GGDEF domain-containing protein [Oscillospiraceae bacterium]|nr:GGDEF domain-containing protein [Oscillospiraceae bacterium]
MKQFQFIYQNQNQLRNELTKIRQWEKSRITSSVVFCIFSEVLEKETLDNICLTIRQELPDALYMGSSTNGNIMNGHVETEIVIVCTVMEYPSTRAELLQMPLNAENAIQTVHQLSDYIAENPWVKAVEMLVTIRGMSMTGFCEELGKLPVQISVFGGGAFSSDMDNEACVFSKAGDYSTSSVVFLLMGGEDFYVTTMHVTGWKPLGKKFLVTRSEGSMLYELDHKPAYDVYYRYLNIRNDEHFFSNTLEFPFFYEHHGMNILRAPIASQDDGSLVMTSDVDENVVARMAYGDPWTILAHIRRSGQKIQEFHPEVIRVYSCAARRTFWGMDEISKETMPFQSVAPTSGFYTSGEFLRTGEFVNQHNVTLVIAGMREGIPNENQHSDFQMNEEQFSGKVSMINRLATFIEAATEELEEANQKLAFMAVSDGLTQLCNRHEIERRIKEAIEECGRRPEQKLSLIMLDIDNFKKVNDTYGHKEGDNVIIGLSKLLRDGIAAHNPDASAGRWGGEEFMLMLPYPIDYVMKAAEDIRSDFEALEFTQAGHRTVSVGVTEFRPGESSDALCIRVDKALYQAKESGKNRVIVL